ncbi:very-long-chain (3R)-3-hydroxyacyl-CoA dehydratase 1-like [Uloborus diversus]|uniref:very-long-chain (3R)-3-hydroxyacyl-CoA dehydratase 1-like n=1 Tax=Uloborus diversus TaxID=327109 RepID=UPI00240A06EA|nr:very-long-chain (3R)-3-hydroxyacyl-CoA dehydratase 1-like [Uloborus diversus]
MVTSKENLFRVIKLSTEVTDGLNSRLSGQTWSYILFQTVKFLLKYKSVVGLWKICGTSLLIFQSLAMLEVLHCILGLVPSNPVVTFVQVASRVMQVWGIMLPIEKVQTSPTFAITMIAWGLTEVVRYSFYCTNLLGKPPKFITWCRYSLFYVLYPAGVVGEVGNTLLALDIIKKTQMFSLLLPNPLNISFSYYYANILMMLTYIPIFPQLFGHMVRQRKKVLGNKDKSS